LYRDGRAGGDAAHHPRLVPDPEYQYQSLMSPYSDIQSIEGCKAEMADWSGGLFDTKRNRLIIHGGGHNGYYGNEIYAIDLNANPIAPVLVQDASHGAGISNVTNCPEVYSDGNPVAVHSYSGLVYVSSLDRYLRYSGSRSNCGFFGSSMWEYDPTGFAWTQITLGSTRPNPGAMAVRRRWLMIRFPMRFISIKRTQAFFGSMTSMLIHYAAS